MPKILIVANNCKWKSWDEKIKALKLWYSPAFDLEVDLVHTKFKNIPFEQYAPGNVGVARDWYDKNVSVLASDKYDVVLFTVNLKQWKGKEIRGWRTENNLGVEELQVGSDEHGKYSYMGFTHPGGRWFNVARHEIAHAVYHKQRKVDNTHKWWDLGKLENVLLEIKEYVVTLTRDTDNGKQTTGTLTADGFKCSTLERPWLDNKKNVSCIPKGKYHVVFSFSPKFMKGTYEILNVPNRSGVRFHSGNFVFDVEGCILLGNGYKDINGDGQLDIVNSRVAIKQFEDLLGRQPFTLIIK